MNRQDIRERVKDYLDRTDLDSRINGWIEDTRQDIALKYNFNYLYWDATAFTSAGTARYPLPLDYMGHLTLWVNDKKLARVGARELDELIGTDIDVTTTTSYLTYSSSTTGEQGEPDYYVDRGMEFDLYPTPDSEYTMMMRYYAQPTEWDEDTDNDYMSKFHFEAIIWGTCLRGAMFLEEDTRIAIYADAYKSAIEEMVRREKDAYQKNVDLNVRMKTWQDYDLTLFKRKMKVVVPDTD